MAKPSEVGAEQHARSLEFRSQNHGIIIRPGEVVRFLRVEHRPFPKGVIPRDVPEQAGLLSQMAQRVTVDAGSKANRAGTNLARSKQPGHQFRAAGVMQVAVGKAKRRQAIDPLRAKKGFGDELHGVARPAINQDPARRFGGVNINAEAPVVREDG